MLKYPKLKKLVYTRGCMDMLGAVTRAERLENPYKDGTMM
jgi:hypothetical protein